MIPTTFAPFCTILPRTNKGCNQQMNIGLLRTKLNDSEFIHLSYRPFIPSARKIELPQPSRVGLSGNAWSAGLKDLPVAPSVVPHSLFNHASAREALKQQIKSFGAIRTGSTIKTSKVSYKVALKHAALNKTLMAAFATRGAYGAETLSLDPNQSSDWIPTTESPMDALEAEDYTTTTLNEIYAKLTPQQVLVAELLSDGKSHKEIGVILGISQQSVTDRVIRMRNRLS